ncbi:hypothetical protein [Sphingomonas sp.]|jgi:hypothetical protein|uniref:hypothetical protein n=1 Tax=Sphingomonas sp. TaxID=28214 RepID=UPI0035C83747
MVYASPTSADPAASGTYVVRDPRRSDALSGSLKAAFRQDQSLPGDMAQMLALLSKVPR